MLREAVKDWKQMESDCVGEGFWVRETGSVGSDYLHTYFV